MSDALEPQAKRRLSPVAWAAIGCTVLVLLALATLGSCGWLVSRVVDELTHSGNSVSTGGTRPASAAGEERENVPRLDSPEVPPDWIPRFADAATDEDLQSAGADRAGGTYSFVTHRPVSAVLDFYRDELEASGFNLEGSSLSADDQQGALLGGSHTQRQLGISIMVAPDETGTKVTIHYAMPPAAAP